jgi:hypothetical protein
MYMMIIIFWEMHRVALIRTDVSEDRIASIFRVHECEQVTERSEVLAPLLVTKCFMPLFYCILVCLP